MCNPKKEIKNFGDEITDAASSAVGAKKDAASSYVDHTKQIITDPTKKMFKELVIRPMDDLQESLMPEIPEVGTGVAPGVVPELAPSIADADIQAALELGRRRRSQQAGKESTVRTTPLGVTQRGEVQKKELLGV